MTFAPLVVSAALFLVTAAVNLQMPLYTRYAAEGGYGVGATTVMFACYVAALIPMLTGLGGVSDRLGRRRTLGLALLAGIVATLLVRTVPSFEMLTVARFLQGVGVALAAGASTAYLAELFATPDAPRRAAALVSAMTSLGFGCGALFTWAGLQLDPGRPLSYTLYPVVAVAVLLLLQRVPDRAPRQAGSCQAGPLLRLPAVPAGTWPFGLAILAAWAITGMAIAIVPAQLARFGLAPWGGVAVFFINGCGVLCQPLARRMASRAAVRLGLAVAPAGYAVLAWGAWTGSLPLLIAGAAIAGSACYGFTFLGGLGAVSEAAGAERARAASGYFLFAYVGFCLPVVGIGVLADLLGLGPALIAFGAALAAMNLGIGVFGLERPSLSYRG